MGLPNANNSIYDQQKREIGSDNSGSDDNENGNDLSSIRFTSAKSKKGQMEKLHGLMTKAAVDRNNNNNDNDGDDVVQMMTPDSTTTPTPNRLPPSNPSYGHLPLQRSQNDIIHPAYDGGGGGIHPYYGPPPPSSGPPPGASYPYYHYGPPIYSSYPPAGGPPYGGRAPSNAGGILDGIATPNPPYVCGGVVPYVGGRGGVTPLPPPPYGGGPPPSRAESIPYQAPPQHGPSTSSAAAAEPLFYGLRSSSTSQNIGGEPVTTLSGGGSAVGDIMPPPPTPQQQLQEQQTPPQRVYTRNYPKPIPIKIEPPIIHPPSSEFRMPYAVQSNPPPPNPPTTNLPPSPALPSARIEALPPQTPQQQQQQQQQEVKELLCKLCSKLFVFERDRGLTVEEQIKLASYHVESRHMNGRKLFGCDECWRAATTVDDDYYRTTSQKAARGHTLHAHATRANIVLLDPTKIPYLVAGILDSFPVLKQYTARIRETYHSLMKKGDVPSLLPTPADTSVTIGDTVVARQNKPHEHVTRIEEQSFRSTATTNHQRVSAADKEEQQKEYKEVASDRAVSKQQQQQQGTKSPAVVMEPDSTTTNLDLAAVKTPKAFNTAAQHNGPVGTAVGPSSSSSTHPTLPTPATVSATGLQAISATQSSATSSSSKGEPPTKPPAKLLSTGGGKPSDNPRIFCSGCQKSFIAMRPDETELKVSRLAKHIEIYHLPRNVFKCSLCSDRSFRTANGCLAHIRGQHTSTNAANKATTKQAKVLLVDKNLKNEVRSKLDFYFPEFSKQIDLDERYEKYYADEENDDNKPTMGTTTDKNNNKNEEIKHETTTATTMGVESAALTNRASRRFIPLPSTTINPKELQSPTIGPPKLPTPPPPSAMTNEGTAAKVSSADGDLMIDINRIAEPTRQLTQKDLDALTSSPGVSPSHGSPATFPAPTMLSNRNIKPFQSTHTRRNGNNNNNNGAFADGSNGASNNNPANRLNHQLQQQSNKREHQSSKTGGINQLPRRNNVFLDRMQRVAKEQKLSTFSGGFNTGQGVCSRPIVSNNGIGGPTGSASANSIVNRSLIVKPDGSSSSSLAGQGIVKRSNGPTASSSIGGLGGLGGSSANNLIVRPMVVTNSNQSIVNTQSIVAHQNSANLATRKRPSPTPIVAQFKSKQSTMPIAAAAPSSSQQPNTFVTASSSSSKQQQQQQKPMAKLAAMAKTSTSTMIMSSTPLSKTGNHRPSVNNLNTSRRGRPGSVGVPVGSHGQAASVKHTCTACKFVVHFDGKNIVPFTSQVRFHLEREHMKKDLYSCNYCSTLETPAKFMTWLAAKSHMKNHHPEKSPMAITNLIRVRFLQLRFFNKSGSGSEGFGGAVKTDLSTELSKLFPKISIAAFRKFAFQ